MAFPSVSQTNTTNGTTATATAALNLPTGILAGDLLIVYVRVAIIGAIGWPAGWVEVFDESPDAADDVNALAWRKADGSEGSTVTISNGNAKFASMSWRITGAESPTVQAPEVGARTTGSATQPDAGTVTPTGGSKDYLWITVYGMEGEQTGVTTYPTNYASNQLFANSGTAGAVTTNVTMGAANRTATASSENAGVWSVAGTLDDWTAFTIAVHPSDVRTLGWRGRYADTALQGPERPVMQGGMTPGCRKAPDVLVRRPSGLWVPRRAA